MRSVLVGAFMLAASASQASAQISFTSTQGAPDKGYGSQTLLVDFNDPNTSSYTGIGFGGMYSILSNSVSGAAAAPAGTNTGFFAVPNINSATNSGTAIISFKDYLGSRSFSALSFYWGSIDSYNKLELLDAQGAVLQVVGTENANFITGTDVYNLANGNQTAAFTNQRLFLDLSKAPTFTSLRITSNGRAFEIDDIAGSLTPTAVPEPASIALLSAGVFGLVGAARRRRA